MSSRLWPYLSILLSLAILEASPIHTEETSPPRTHYFGRPVAQTMHWSGAGWLMRATREEEEKSSAMLEALGVKPGDTICDLGCGSGYHALRLASRVGKKGKVFGVDIQPEMLDMLRKRAANEGMDNITPVLGAVDRPNLPDAACDLILMVDVYHEISHPQRMLRALRQALKPEGRLVFVEFRAEDPEVPIKTVHKMSKRQLLREIPHNGFHLVQQHDGLPWQHLMVFSPAPLDSRRVAFPGGAADPVTLALLRRIAGGGKPKIHIEVVESEGEGSTRSGERGNKPGSLVIGSFDTILLNGPRTERVIYDDIPEEIRKRAAAARSAKIRSVLVQPLPLDGSPETVKKLASRYGRAADELGAQLAPVGPAWVEALRLRPGIVLRDPASQRPTPAGAYLTAAVIYSVICGQEPPSLRDDLPAGFDADTADFLRKVAWQSINEEPGYITRARDRGERIPPPVRKEEEN